MNNPVRMHGFAFVELLVSVVIIGFGLLAISALQTNALQATNAAYLRTAASEYAVAFSERMRTNTADSIYRYDEDNSVYILAPVVACYLQAASNTALTDRATECAKVTNASQTAIVNADIASMTQWISNASSTLPQGTWALDLLRNGAVASGITVANCNFSLAAGAAASQPCSLQVTVTWQESRASATAASISYTFR